MDCKDDDTCKVSWALSVRNSHNIHIVGAGLYSWFFNDYDQKCIEKMTCQKRLVWIDEPSSDLFFYNVITIGTGEMISMPNRAILAKDNQMLVGKSPWPSIIAAWVKSISLPSVLLGINVWVTSFYMSMQPNPIYADLTHRRPEAFMEKTPKQCLGLDTCSRVGVNEYPSDLAKEATQYRGYLCVLDFWYNWCRANPKINVGTYHLKKMRDRYVAAVSLPWHKGRSSLSNR